MTLNTLYKKTATGAAQEWTINYDETSYWTVSGKVGGKMVTSAPTVCKPKNIGKKNETTAAYQAEVQAKAKHQKKLDEGYVEDIDDIAGDPNRVDPMLANNYADHLEKISFPIFSQPKFDGLRCIITRQGAFSRKWKPFVTLPHIIEALQPVFDLLPGIVAFDGEAYNHDLKNDFEEILSLVKQPKATAEDLERSRTSVQYHIYDLVLDNAAAPFKTRMDVLHEAIQSADNSPYLCEVVTGRLLNQEEMDHAFETYVEHGYEGQMLRSTNGVYRRGSRSSDLLKRKDFIDKEFKIVGSKMGDGSRTDCICLKCELPNGLTFDSVPIGGVEYLKRLWEHRDELVGLYATVKFQNYTKDGKPRFNNTIKIRTPDMEEYVV